MTEIFVAVLETSLCLSLPLHFWQGIIAGLLEARRRYGGVPSGAERARWFVRVDPGIYKIQPKDASICEV
ncbi:hypothetical protein N7490_006630 [Penicillium lividum]|nr:hypothetical protein N7490_006630 [Penicillium lividum]